MSDNLLQQAQNGDINAFQTLFIAFQPQLKSYLFRLMANRQDAEDLAHDTFIRAFDKLDTFAGNSSLKTWVFTIATRIAYNYMERRSRWTEDVNTQAKEQVRATPSLDKQIQRIAAESSYEIREHIDTCFTCMAKTLPILQQVALMLKDVYDFSVKEIMLILDRTEGQVKYDLQSARKTMTRIFERRCALVSKKGVCHQCSELNGWLNPKQDQQAARMKIEMVQKADELNQQRLLALRSQLVKAIDPLHTDGYSLQHLMMKCNQLAMGEAQLSANGEL